MSLAERKRLVRATFVPLPGSTVRGRAIAGGVPGPSAEASGPGQRRLYFSFGSVCASSEAMMWYPGVFMWMLKVPSQKNVKVQTLATGTGI